MLRVLFLAGKLARLDATIAFAGDVDRQRRVMESVTDGVGDDRIAEHGKVPLFLNG